MLSHRIGLRMYGIHKPYVPPRLGQIFYTRIRSVAFDGSSTVVPGGCAFTTFAGNDNLPVAGFQAKHLLTRLGFPAFVPVVTRGICLQ